MLPRTLRLSWIAAALVSIAFACSEFSPTEETPAPERDASTDTPPVDDGGSPGTDGGGTGQRCTHDAPFTSILPVDGVNSPLLEGVPRLTSDELVIYFDRRATGADPLVIYRATRAKRTDAFGAPETIPGLTAGMGHPLPSADDLELTFEHFEIDQRTLKRVRRAVSTEPFGAIEVHPFESPLVNRMLPFFSRDGSEALFVLYQSAVTSYDIARASLAPDGGVLDSGLVDALNTSASDSEPVLSLDGLAVYFYSERGSIDQAGSIWISQRDAPTSAFRAPRRIEELGPDGGSSFSSPGWLSDDACRLYFYGQRSAGTGWDIYVAERTPK